MAHPRCGNGEDKNSVHDILVRDVNAQSIAALRLRGQQTPTAYAACSAVMQERKCVKSVLLKVLKTVRGRIQAELRMG